MTNHRPVEKRLNVRREVARLRTDPLENLFESASHGSHIAGAKRRYDEAYYLYERAMERVLEQTSTCVRYRKGPHYVRKYGGGYGPGQRKLAEKWNRLRPFFEIDVSSCILHTRILLDRVVGMSRAFLRGPRLPSFTSFSEHKKFFHRFPDEIPGQVEYSRYMREETEWFDVPIKYVRDKFFVHQGPQHEKLFTVGWERDDNLTLTFVQLDRAGRENAPCIQFNPWRMSYDIEGFLRWYGLYAKKVESSANNC